MDIPAVKNSKTKHSYEVEIFLFFEPVNGSEQWREPVLVDFAVSVEEDDDHAFGLEGASIARSDQTFAFLVPD